MMGIRISSVLLASVVALGASVGVSAAGVEALSLDSCRTLALSNNKNLRIRSEAVRMARYQNREAFAAYLPALDFNGGYMYNQKELSLLSDNAMLPTKSFDPHTGSYQYNLLTDPQTGVPVRGPGGQYIPTTVAEIPKESMTFDVKHVVFGAFTLTQPVFMGGKIVAMNRLTHYAEQMAGHLHNAEAENIIYAVDGAYWQVVSLKAKQKLARSYVALLDTLHSNVEAMVRQGVATRSDLLSVDVKLNQANVDLTKVDNGLVLSRMALAQVCGLPIDASLTLSDEDAELKASSKQLMPATNYDMSRVYERRQDLAALQSGIECLRQKERVAMSDMLPKVAVTGAWSFSNPNLFDGFSKRFSGAFSVGAVVSVPLWHWGGNYNKYKAAQTQTHIAQLEMENAREMVSLQVSQSAFKAQEAVKTLHMTESNLAKADENLRQASLGFREGVMTTDNVMEAQTAWLKAHSEVIDAAIDVYLCDVYLSKVLGTLPYSTDN